MRKLTNAEIPRLNKDEALSIDRHPIVVVLENIRSAYNVGSIVRTCDAALVERIVVVGYTPSPDHPKVRKTSLGAESVVPWEHWSKVGDAIRDLKDQGYLVTALEITDAPTGIQSLGSGDFPLAVIIGNEVNGVSEEALALVDKALEIPQYGFKQSINVAVAAGIAVMGLVERYKNA